LPDSILRLLGRLTRGFLGLLGGSAYGFLSLPRCLPRSVLSLLRDLSSLSGYSSCGILCSLYGLPGLLGHLPVGLLGGLVYCVLHAMVLGCLVDPALYLVVGVNHLLDLGLCLFLRGLLREALQLGAGVLQLGPCTTE
jgi:hypothetical protein